MPFVVLRGSVHVVGYAPDGDSIRFKPDDPARLARLAGPPARVNGRGHVQLRIEAIDALETHYSPPGGGGPFRGPRALAEAATDALLAFVGITEVRRAGSGAAEPGAPILSARDGTRAHVLARAVEKNGRPVAFLFPGEPAEADGAEAFLGVERLVASWNAAALRQGLAYPTYYRGLFADLRDALTAEVESARAARRGVHANDATQSGIEPTLEFLVDGAPVLPKLFRRLTSHLVARGTIDGFLEALAAAREPVLDLTNRNFTHLDNLIELKDGRVRLLRAPEELVFDEMAQRPGSPFDQVLSRWEAGRFANQSA